MENGLTKEKTKILQGLAILMMLYHHLFCIPDRLHTQYISVLNFNSINIELKLAWFCKLCVAIYSFISGYGLYITADKLNSNCEKTRDVIINDYKIVLTRLLSFYKVYWVVFFIFVPVGFVFFKRSFHVGEFIRNLTGISSSYNGEWWYVYQYIKMLLVFPLVDVFSFIYKKNRIRTLKLAIVLLGSILILLVLKVQVFISILHIIFGNIRINYMLVFLVGYLFAKMDLYKKIFNYTIKYNIPEKKFAFAILLIVILSRTILADKAAYSTVDFMLVPFFIYAVLTILNSCKIQKILEVLGKYSTFMWLTHTFLCYYYFQKYITFVKISTLMYFWLLGLSLVISWCLDKLYNYIVNRLNDVILYFKNYNSVKVFE